MTIRKFSKKIFGMQDLIQRSAVSIKAAQFLKAAVESRTNILISGGTSSGKTTFLNILGGLISRRERIITIEDTLELMLPQENWIQLEAVYDLSKPVVSMRDCLANSLRMRPDRIIVGETRRDEAYDMLQAMNTGHDGSMTTIHANGSRDALSRMEALVQNATSLPLIAIRKQMTSALDFVVQLERSPEGQRMVTEIIELTGMEKEVYTTQPIFQRSYSVGEKSRGELVATGLVPKNIDAFNRAGANFPAGFFNRPQD